MKNQTSVNKKPKNQLIAIVVIIIIIFGIMIPLCFPKLSKNLTMEEKDFGDYTILVAKIDAFDNPLYKLITLKTIMTSIQKEKEGECTIYDKKGNNKSLNSSYTSIVEAKTFFGLTLSRAKIYCDGSSDIIL